MTDLDREQRKIVILLACDAIRTGVESVFLETKMHEQFEAAPEDFKNGFEMALALVHDAILDTMRDVEKL